MRETILCPHSDHLSFLFSVTASLFLCYSFFLSSHYGTKSHTVVIIIFCATNDFSFFFLNFRIISKSILHNHSNSIRKLNYDRRKWANTFLFFFFSSCPFFLELSCVTRLFFFFLLLLFSVLDFSPFSFWGCWICSSCFWSLFLVSYFLLLIFSALDFSPFSFWGVPNLFFLFLVSFSCFLFSGGLVFSLSLPRSSEQAAPK